MEQVLESKNNQFFLLKKVNTSEHLINKMLLTTGVDVIILGVTESGKLDVTGGVFCFSIFW